MQRFAVVMLRRLATNARGVALVEFAFSLPILLVMFMGGYSVSELVACHRKVAVATRALTDLVSRSMSPAIIYNNPQTASARSQLSASAVVLSPYRLDKATQEISLLRVCDATHAYVVWSQAQTQNANGSTVTPTTPSQTAGTLPANETQSAAAIVSIPGDMVTTPMIPVSPDGSNVCGNLSPGTSTRTQVGTAGAWLLRGRITYNFTLAVSTMPITTTPITDTIYMVPRLF
jgi:Flp pilus assembly protein TadG